MIYSTGEKYDGDWLDDKWNGNGRIYNKYNQYEIESLYS